MSNAYMPLYTGDYLKKTRRLNDAEHGAYLLILMALWDEGGSLPYDQDELKAIAKSGRNWPKIWAKIQGYFIISDGLILHQKVIDTLAETARKRQSYVARGQKGGRVKSKKSKENKGSDEAKLKPSSSNQAKGLVSPSKEGAYHSLAPEGAAALEVLRASCAESGHQKLELTKLETTIESYSDGVLYVTDRWTAETYSERLGPQLRAARLKLAVQDKRPDASTVPTLKVVNGDTA